MEIFFNVMWVAITLALCAAWLSRLRRNRTECVLPTIGVQLIALAVLAAILLPVISLTDDLQATTNPAETEHIARRVDLQPSPEPSLHRLPVALALLVAPPAEPPMALTAFLSAEQPASPAIVGFFRALATRPPPAA